MEEIVKKFSSNDEKRKNSKNMDKNYCEKLKSK